MGAVNKVARRLQNLMVTEISSADRGAGQGCKVVLMKRDVVPTIEDFRATIAGLRKSGLRDTIASDAPLRDFCAAVAGSHLPVAKQQAMTTEAFGAWADHLNAAIPAAIEAAVEKATDDAPSDDVGLLSNRVTQALERLQAALSGLTTSTAPIDQKIATSFAALDAYEDELALVASDADRVGDVDLATGDAGRRVDVAPTVGKNQMDLSVIQKALDRGETMPVPRAAIYKVMCAGAEAIRKGGETPEKAFARYVTDTDEGRMLMRAQKHAAGPSVIVAQPTHKAAPIAVGSAYEQLMAKAAELRKSDPKLTIEQAFAMVYSDKSNSSLVVMHKRETGRASHFDSMAAEYRTAHPYYSDPKSRVAFSMTHEGRAALALDERRGGYDAMMAKADAAHTADPSLSREQHFARIYKGDAAARTVIRKEEHRAA
jgi:hypothetical protein